MAVPQSILAAYEMRRDRHARELAERKRQVAAIPAYAALEAQVAEALMRQGKAALLQPENIHAVETETREVVAGLRAQQQKVLLDNRLPVDFLQPPYDCAMCQDTGFIGAGGTPCACLLQQLADSSYAEITPLLAREHFDAFDLHRYADTPAEGLPVTVRNITQTPRGYAEFALRYCRRYADMLPAPDRMHLLLCGLTGVGKSFLCHCIARHAIDRGLTVLLLPFYTLQERVLRRGDDVKSAAIAADVLVLDDIGAEPLLNQVTVETLYQLLNERNRFNKPMVFSTNLLPRELGVRYTERVASRMLDAQRTRMVYIPGQDQRRLRDESTGSEGGT